MAAVAVAAVVAAVVVAAVDQSSESCSELASSGLEWAYDCRSCRSVAVADRASHWECEYPEMGHR